MVPEWRLAHLLSFFSLAVSRDERRDVVFERGTLDSEEPMQLHSDLMSLALVAGSSSVQVFRGK